VQEVHDVVDAPDRPHLALDGQHEVAVGDLTPQRDDPLTHVDGQVRTVDHPAERLAADLVEQRHVVVRSVRRPGPEPVDDPRRLAPAIVGLAFNRPHLAAEQRAAPVPDLGSAAAAAGRVEAVGSGGARRGGERELDEACSPQGCTSFVGVVRPLPATVGRRTAVAQRLFAD
jgi:hypothetical protein